MRLNSYCKDELFVSNAHSIDSLPLSRPKAVKSADIARIYAPHLKAFRP